MINLLPPQRKEALVLEKNKKLAIILGSSFLVGLFSLMLVLLSVQFYLLSQTDVQRSLLEETLEKYENPDTVFFKNIITSSNVMLSTINGSYAKTSHLNRALKIISQIQKPEGLYVTNIQMSRIEGDAIAVALTGQSATRTDLLAFKEAIEQDERISQINFPPSNWTKPSDFSFFISFEIR